MKRLNHLFFTIVALAMLASCGKDDEGDVKSDLVGSWKFSKIEIIELSIDGKDFVEYFVEAFGLTEEEAAEFEAEFEANFQADADLGDITIEFKSDNTYVSSSPDEEDETGTWSLSSDGKTLTVDDQTFKITSLTKTQLVATLSEEETQEGVTIKIEVEYTFTK